ncbi:MAG: nuclease-related domain-containing protein [Nocardioides sp.]|nr:nuclease-related domain-containing protein [Nocardioides sp.]
MTVDSEANSKSGKRMKLRYAGTCRLCGAEFAAKTEAIYERETKTVRCLECVASGQLDAEEVSAADDLAAVLEVEVSLPLAAGAAGASARREYERRKARDDARLREKWGRFGGIAAAFADEKQSTNAWERGAVGEEKLGARLDGLAGDDLAVLHDRGIPGSRANIDHLAITRSGIWVIDAKRYKGRPELKVEGGILRPRSEKVLVGRRDCTKLVDGVLKQVDLVRAVVGDVPVTGALCFVESDWPMIGGAFTTREVHVVWPKRLAKLLSLECSGGVDVARVHATLARAFPAA